MIRHDFAFRGFSKRRGVLLDSLLSLQIYRLQVNRLGETEI
jgi:hypothetical protein